MSDNDIIALHNKRIHLCITGGGTSIIPQLLNQGGASQWLEEVRVPYSLDASHKLMQRRDLKSVSPEAAEALARGLQRENASWTDNHIYIAFTAQLIKKDERPDRKHFFWWCIGSDDNTYSWQSCMMDFSDIIIDPNVEFIFKRQQQETYLTNTILLTLKNLK